MAKGYTTEALIEAFLGITIDATSSPTSTQLVEWIEEAEQEIDDRAGVSFTSVLNTNEIYNLDEYSYYSRPAFQSHYYCETMYPELRLKLTKRPIVSVTSLFRNQASHTGADEWSALTENTGTGGDYVVDKRSGEIIFLRAFPIPQKRSVKITYNHGHSTIPKTVQRLATLIVAKTIVLYKMSNSQYSSTDNITIEGISISKGVSQSVSYIDKLTDEIEKLFQNIGDVRTEVA